MLLFLIEHTRNKKRFGKSSTTRETFSLKTRDFIMKNPETKEAQPPLSSSQPPPSVTILIRTTTICHYHHNHHHLSLSSQPPPSSSVTIIITTYFLSFFLSIYTFFILSFNCVLVHRHARSRLSWLCRCIVGVY